MRSSPTVILHANPIFSMDVACGFRNSHAMPAISMLKIVFKQSVYGVSI